MFSAIRYVTLVGLFLSGVVTAQAGLIGLYTFEGNANDVSGNGNDGVVIGATLTAAGFMGQAYAFGGSSANDYISLPFNIGPSTYPQLTMGAWVNSNIVGDPAGSIAPKVISSDNGNYDRTLGIDFRNGTSATVNSDWSAFKGSSGVVDSDIAVTTGVWVFLAVVYNGANVDLYVNNQVISQSNAAFDSSSLNAVIGKMPDSAATSTGMDSSTTYSSLTRR